MIDGLRNSLSVPRATIAVIVAAGMAALTMVGAASAQTPRGMTIAEASAIVQELGITQLTIDEENAIFELNDVEFGLEGYNCDADRCTEFLFIAGFDLEDGLTLEQINRWNADALGGRAFLDDDADPWVDHVVSVSGPQDSGAMREGAALWIAVMDDFQEFISTDEDTEASTS